MHIGLIISVDGTVRIDKDHPHRELIIKTIKDHGHEIEYTDEGHPRIKGWNADLGRS